MGLLGSMFADRILGPADEQTGQRPGDPTGIASVMMNVGGGVLGAAAVAQAAPEIMNQIRSGMDGLVSGGRSVSADAASIPAQSTPAVAQAVTPDLPPRA